PPALRAGRGPGRRSPCRPAPAGRGGGSGGRAKGGRGLSARVTRACERSAGLHSPPRKRRAYPNRPFWLRPAARPPGFVAPPRRPFPLGRLRGLSSPNNWAPISSRSLSPLFGLTLAIRPFARPRANEAPIGIGSKS